ncbi:MAG: dTDP-glucose 4,6-dehydratase [Sulfobacillus acidophilus]|uniref:dTDP-glucose 4,6-dehydratase n=1 Tax=Sulfobacillus acidophilus TaxID=53633 RepID=A0A2T2WPC1_9FIRM|nr:MAG: dTDP-glucose 4,6-dehydratase [Sulfobacillus acidophilus]
MRILVTGGLGFIGSHLVRRLLREPEVLVTNLDVLTYAGNLANVADVAGSDRYVWEQSSITDEVAVDRILRETQYDAIINLAAESHVDRSISDGLPFVKTNVVGTQVLLEAARRHQVGRFVQVSTDEVYGSLGEHGYFTELSPLQPNSPYSASKASADLLVLAAYRTYGQNVVVTRCSNNYGPYQFPEKLIPLYITNGIEGKPWPLYGDGLNVRDWLHVEDHVDALWLALSRGQAGEIYNIGGHNERTNRQVALTLLDIMGLSPDIVVSVPDRPGHDRRYAIDPSKAMRELGFFPRHDWTEGMRETVRWYETHPKWWQTIKSGEYLQFYQRQYGRLGDAPHES